MERSSRLQCSSLGLSFSQCSKRGLDKFNSKITSCFSIRCICSHTVCPQTGSSFSSSMKGRGRTVAALRTHGSTAQLPSRSRASEVPLVCLPRGSRQEYRGPGPSPEQFSEDVWRRGLSSFQCPQLTGAQCVWGGPELLHCQQATGDAEAAARFCTVRRRPAAPAPRGSALEGQSFQVPG